MSDEELIRRGDALAACAPHFQETISALPAVTVGVKPLRYIDPQGDTFDQMRDHARQQPLAKEGDMKLVWVNEGDLYDHAFFFAPLEPVTAPRRYMGQIMAECDCSRQVECEAAQRCLAAPDPAPHVNEPPKSEHDAGNVLTPDPAAIREAAAVVEEEIRQAKQYFPQAVPILRGVSDRILALISKGAADDRA